MSDQPLSEREKSFLAFYEEYRRKSQSTWYRGRYSTYEQAHRQSVSWTSIVLFLSSVVSILSATVGDHEFWPWGYEVAWSPLAAVLAATGTAIAAYRTLFGFQENARLYRDADNALAVIGADSPDQCEGCSEAGVRTPAEYVPLVEQVFRREQGQWGQLVSQTRAAVRGEKPDSADDPAPPRGAGQATGGNAAEGDDAGGNDPPDGNHPPGGNGGNGGGDGGGEDGPGNGGGGDGGGGDGGGGDDGVGDGGAAGVDQPVGEIGADEAGGTTPPPGATDESDGAAGQDVDGATTETFATGTGESDSGAGEDDRTGGQPRNEGGGV